MSGAWLQFVASGLTAGAIYALVAHGFSIVYNASHAINFAQGEFVMIGGMSAAPLLALGLPLPLAAIGAVASAVLVALVVEKLAIEPGAVFTGNCAMSGGVVKEMDPMRLRTDAPAAARPRTPRACSRAPTRPRSRGSSASCSASACR